MTPILRDNPPVTTRMLPDQESASGQVAHKFRHTRPPKLADERDGLNDRIASFIARTVGSMGRSTRDLEAARGFNWVSRRWFQLPVAKRCHLRVALHPSCTGTSPGEPQSHPYCRCW